MSTRELAYRIDVTAKSHDGLWWQLCWVHTDRESGTSYEASHLWTSTLGDARRAWQQLDAGRVPEGLDGSLDGWAGLVVSAVQVWVRHRRADGWGPWRRHEQRGVKGIEPVVVEGTREIRSGSLAMPEREVA